MYPPEAEELNFKEICPWFFLLILRVRESPGTSEWHTEVKKQGDLQSFFFFFCGTGI
jgi:hypothetical protein